MSIAFPIIATVVLVSATAIGLWIDGLPMQEWRNRW